MVLHRGIPSTVADASTATSVVAVAQSGYSVRTVTGIRDTCEHMYLITKLGGAVHWLVQWRRCHKYASSDRTAAFKDEGECRMGHPSHLGADKVMRMLSQIGEESDENIGAAKT